MKIIMKNWKNFIKENLSSRAISPEEEYYIEDKERTLTVKTSDGSEHTIQALEIQTGHYEDSAMGSFYYSIDGEEHEWEFHTGWYADGAAWRILEHLGESGSENDSDGPTEIEEAIENFIESQVKRNPNYKPSDDSY